MATLSKSASFTDVVNQLYHFSDSRDIYKINAAAQMTADGTAFLAVTNPVSAAAAIQAGLVAMATQTAVLALDIKSGETSSVITDTLTLVGDGLIVAGAIAAVTGNIPLAAVIETAGAIVTSAAIAIQNWDQFEPYLEKLRVRPQSSL